MSREIEEVESGIPSDCQQKHKKTGEDRTDWEFFEPLDAILGHKPGTHPPVVVDALGDELGLTVPKLEPEQELNEEPSAAEGDADEYLVSPTDSNAGSSHETSSTAGSVGFTPVPSKSQTEGRAVSCGKKRKKTKSEKAESIMHELVDKVIQSSRASELRLMELEEKRMKLEEQQFEREEKQRHDDRRFQMQIFQMLMLGPYHRMPSPLQQGIPTPPGMSAPPHVSSPPRMSSPPISPPAGMPMQLPCYTPTPGPKSHPYYDSDLQ